MLIRPQIRPSTPDDRQRLFAIWDAAVRATHHFLAPRDLAAIADMVLNHYLPTAKLAVIVDEGGQAFGFLGLNGSHIDSLFVHPGHHGQGGGRALVEWAARSRSTLTVDVNEQNEGGRLFYERLRFVEMGRSSRDHDGRPYPLLHLRRTEGVT
ncbi:MULTISPECIES: acetyltransferase [unclassified Chelatococcus]|uniref:acetyltransferase n=1 Tax=unclassified Chelatococcus TaxID=2638111 RepID=UPI001BCDD358|nr:MULTISPECIES: acetyltransferase [unclassified Chelatococcus]CAH1662912.1 Peptidyl-lysine N-acetyltransferase YjaB [Hyphomicrobiales bacterium]MBS7741499.1 acetyltransferase [Chelatococcus sp. HY11]MBX3544482.1 acetyltransferase [Chelatococcus sp.]MCO5078995.1 acetyltransferase [Chelatococcus sp.]CAH1682475.1 Peptidyl-lysine N-acetyltransferase YjaB [Hyphomicrobiales bacterium]